MKKILWLRDEKKAFERRSPLTPENAKKVIEQGHEVIVESSKSRIFKDSEYSDIGCKLVDSWSWKEAPAQAIILGLKELPEQDFPLTHSHIHFAHVYKGQEGAAQMLSRFKEGKGTLFDLEYLTDAEGKRIAAFGHWAGFAGAGVAINGYCDKVMGRNFSALSDYENQEDFINELRNNLRKTNSKPKVIIIGAKGRCGKGAIELLDHLDIKATCWDYEETKGGGPFKEIAEHDIFINTVLVTKKIPPFINKESITKDDPLKIIADVSCDPTSDLNPIPLYNDATTWEKPFTTDTLVNILAVDNLPSLLPRESSIDYSDQLTPHILGLLNESDLTVWNNSEKSFQNALKDLSVSL